MKKALRFPRIPPSRLRGGEPRQGSLPRSKCMCVRLRPFPVFTNVHLRRGCFRCHGKFLRGSHSVSAGSGPSLGWSCSGGPSVSWLLGSPPCHAPAQNKEPLCLCAPETSAVHFSRGACVSAANAGVVIARIFRRV